VKDADMVIAAILEQARKIAEEAEAAKQPKKKRFR
jgi:hypothetical protein